MRSSASSISAPSAIPQLMLGVQVRRLNSGGSVAGSSTGRQFRMICWVLGANRHIAMQKAMRAAVNARPPIFSAARPSTGNSAVPTMDMASDTEAARKNTWPSKTAA